MSDVQSKRFMNIAFANAGGIIRTDERLTTDSLVEAVNFALQRHGAKPDKLNNQILANVTELVGRPVASIIIDEPRDDPKITNALDHTLHAAHVARVDLPAFDVAFY